MRWVYDTEHPMTSLVSFYKGLSEDQTLEEIEKKLETLHLFPLNFMFVTKSGHHGYHMIGTFPKRKYNVHQGVYPKKGWLKDNLWEGLVPPEDHPRIYNPKSGIIVSTNNLATTKNFKHGVSHAHSFTQRFIRLNELYKERSATRKLNKQDMIDGQLDTFDIQARESTSFILRNVDLGLESVLKALKKSRQEAETIKKLYTYARDILLNWDFRFSYDQIQPSIYLAFEFNFATYFQEAKIDDADVRRAIAGNVIIENFFYKEIHRWAAEKDPRQ